MICPVEGCNYDTYHLFDHLKEYHNETIVRRTLARMVENIYRNKNKLQEQMEYTGDGPLNIKNGATSYVAQTYVKDKINLLNCVLNND